MDYWQECIDEAFEDAGISASKEQIEIVVSWVEGAHENYGMAHGHHAIPNPLADENARLKRELDAEKRKEACPQCKGEGWITEQGPYHSYTSNCWKCRGEGRV